MAAFRTSMLVILLGVVPNGPLHAQWGAELHYLHYQEADFGDARLGGHESGLRLRSPSLDFAGGRFDAGADYVYTHYAYDHLATRDRDLHRLGLPLRWIGGGRHNVHVELVPTIAASSNVFKDLFSRGGSDDYSLYGRVFVERAPASGWGWRAGAAYDDAFGDREAYPLLAAIYRSERVTLDLGWPQMQASWQPHAQWRFALDVAPAGGRWHVVSDERDGAEFFYTTEAWRGTVSAQWIFAERWRLDAGIGIEFDRHHDFEDDTGARIDRDAESAGTFNLALRYGL